MRSWLLVPGCAALALAWGGAGLASRSSCPICGKNLIVNPGAEAGTGAAGDDVVKIPGWKGSFGFTAGRYAWASSDVTAASPGPPGRGKNYFYGGPAVTGSGNVTTGTQTIPLPRAGGLHATLSGWLGGYSSQGDDTRLTVTFSGSGSQTLGILKIGPVSSAQRGSVSKLLFRSAGTMVPRGTTSAKVVLTMTRYAGSDNDGLADNLSLVLSG